MLWPDRRRLRWDMIDLDGLLAADQSRASSVEPLYGQGLSREGEAALIGEGLISLDEIAVDALARTFVPLARE